MTDMVSEKQIHISVVIPVYGCAASLPELTARLDASLQAITQNYEIILVNDASPDAAWTKISELAKGNERIVGISLSRNFGQHRAICAGLDHASGEWTVVMDCDLQDRPEEIAKLYKKAQEGFDSVVGLRSARKDSLYRKISSKVFYTVFNFLAGTRISSQVGNFGIYSRKVIDAVSSLKEQNRSFGLFVLWVGFRRAEIEIEHAEREYGRSSYTLVKMLSLAFDSMLAHSNRVLKIAVKAGVFMSVLSLAFAVYLIAKYVIYGVALVGWTSLMVSLFFSTGLIIGAIGVVGLYVGKIFDEAKARPLYLIDSITSCSDSK